MRSDRYRTSLRHRPSLQRTRSRTGPSRGFLARAAPQCLLVVRENLWLHVGDGVEVCDARVCVYVCEALSTTFPRGCWNYSQEYYVIMSQSTIGHIHLRVTQNTWMWTSISASRLLCEGMQETYFSLWSKLFPDRGGRGKSGAFRV